MRLIAVLSTLLLASCVCKGPNPDDPYEPINREVHKFNMAFDATMLKPPARLYKAMLPGPVRGAINNAYDNINMIPTTANDVLQGDLRMATRDTWRFLINSTLGVAGLFDVAGHFGLPQHSNDLGLTLAKWGDKHSPYIVIPFIGPSTIRDGMGMMFEYSLLTPYPYIRDNVVLYSILGLRYVDLRSQLFDTERLMREAIDPYAFIRDAYLQHRNYLISGGALADNTDGTLYVEEDSQPSDYVDE